jgi:signal peptidase I
MQGSPEEFLTAGSALVVEALERFGHIRIRALGTSMAPAIESGDVLELQRCPSDQLGIGDVIVVTGAYGLRVHRLVAKHEQDGREFVVTRGDALRDADGPEPAANVIAHVVGFTRKKSSSTVPGYLAFARLRRIARRESTRSGVAIRNVVRYVARRSVFNVL